MKTIENISINMKTSIAKVFDLLMFIFLATIRVVIAVTVNVNVIIGAVMKINPPRLADELIPMS
jgi:hypothetical protein